MNEWTAELYVHAMAIEREAAARYAELATRMAAAGNSGAAALFGMLSVAEARHLKELRRRAARLVLPALEADYSWPDTRALTQCHALQIALQAEKGARAFFEHAARVSADPDVHALAREMATEEMEHAAVLERMLFEGPRWEDYEARTAMSPEAKPGPPTY